MVLRCKDFGVSEQRLKNALYVSTFVCVIFFRQWGGAHGRETLLLQEGDGKMVS